MGGNTLCIMRQRYKLSEFLQYSLNIILAGSYNFLPVEGITDFGACQKTKKTQLEVESFCAGEGNRTHTPLGTRS